MCVVDEVCYVVCFGKRQSAENSIFPLPCCRGILGESVEKLADNTLPPRKLPPSGQFILGFMEMIFENWCGD